MGGGGGGWGSWSSRKTAAEMEKAVSDATAKDSFGASANTYLQTLLSDYNNRDVEAIRRHLETIQTAVEKEIEGKVELLFGGSIRKNTYVDGLSDVDVLVTVNASELSAASPADVLGYIKGRLTDRLGAHGIKVEAGTLAVTVRYANGTEIQLLPALKTASGVRIASPDGSWSQVVRPREFARKLTEVNKANNGYVVPVIKLFKGIQAQLPPKSQLKGYHIESLAIEAFRTYKDRRTTKDMLRHFVEFAATRVKSPVLDKTGQSRHVDDYLGSGGSVERQRVASSLGRLATRIRTAERHNSIDELKNMFGE
jgi:predicted nucleotidyltransferase